jgi:hypothetical protein
MIEFEAIRGVVTVIYLNSGGEGFALAWPAANIRISAFGLVD